MSLDTDAAYEVIRSLSSQLNLSPEETAYAILNLASETMINAVHDITTSKGIDPKESVLVAGGGAAGINIMLIARELGCKEVLVPKQASALSASGMQFADIMTEETASFFTSSNAFDFDGVSTCLAALSSRLEAFRNSLSDQHSACETRIEFSVEARYASQVWEIDCPVPQQLLENDPTALFESFHVAHEGLYSMRDEGSKIEFITWKAKLIVDTGLKVVHGDKARGLAAVRSERSRECFFGKITSEKTLILKGEDMVPGVKFNGPCIIEEPTTTIVVFPKMSGFVTANNNYQLTFE